MKRVIILLLLIFICSSLFTGCNILNSLFDEVERPVKNQVEMTLMHYFNDDGAIRWIDITTDVFSMTHEDVVFSIKAVDSSDYTQLLRKKLASGDMPDIFMTEHIADLQEFINAGYVADLTGEGFIKGNLKESSTDGAMLDGKVWCVPIETTALGVVYNRDAFTKAGIINPPATYGEFLETCEALKKAGIVPIGAAYSNSLTLRSDFNCDMVQSALKYHPDWLIDIEEGRTKWNANRAQFKEALVRFGQRASYINDDCFDTDWDKVTAMLAEGDVGMVLNSTYAIDSARYKNSMVNLGFFPFPWSDNSSYVKLPLKTTGGLAVNAKSVNRDMAIDVVKFFTHREVGRLFQNFRRTISPVNGLDIVSDPAIKDIETYINNKKFIDISTYSPNFQEDSLNSLLDSVLKEFLLQDGSNDVNKYISMLDEETARIIKANK